MLDLWEITGGCIFGGVVRAVDCFGRMGGWNGATIEQRFPLGGRFVIQVRENLFGIVALEETVCFFGASVEGLFALVQHEDLVCNFERLVAVGRENDGVAEEGKLLQVRTEDF